MSNDKYENDPRRRLILSAAAAAGGAAAVAGLVPFAASMSPSERAKAAGAPVEVDIGKLKPGELVMVEWRGKPVWVLKRTPEMLETLQQHRDQLTDPDSDRSEQPDYCHNETRSIRPEIMVALNVCSHLGCSTSARFRKGVESGIRPDWPGGFYCPCHSSTYDLAGRVFSDKLAPVNLEVPPHRHLSDSRILIGEEIENGA